MKKRLFTGFAAAVMLTSTAIPVTNKLIAKTPVGTKKVSAASTSSAFLDTAAKQAQKASKKYGLYPSVMIAQAIVESNWGQSGLAVNANNLFGMKADDSWMGPTYTSKTREETSAGKSYYVNANFRKYSSYEGSFDDNGKKLREGVSWQPTRYQGAWIENASSYAAATKALTGTYATAHNYNTILNQRITAYDLTQYDPKVSNATANYTVKASGSTYDWPTDHSVSSTSGSVSKGDNVTVDKTITYYDGSQRMHIAGKGWVDGTSLDTGSALPPASQAPKGEKKITKMLMHNAYIYNAKGKRVKGIKALKADNNIPTYGTKTINGKSYYRISTNQYIAAGNIDGKMRALKHNAYVYNDYGNRDNSKVMKKNQSVATYGSAVTIYSKKYYKIGTGHYIKKANF
ncbi:SLAP domain-containing protein [Lactobacillus acetotolerans]|uniref:N-acetylmuramidase n=1 Tax=Lactobacillus acetotolerans TaxID=1600 RepID=A0A5P5ZHY7_9LACO|nr:SLAP domain-containing protein [Lactobacillus acetotolerans]KRN41473.1 N-acetylmuramoyl-L-alanine amidase [Lactobacillus acetotolerans DSM 20749 = JCM 3825]QFG50682.1 N-acetylmuramidase [Lactobacillus acetotolerans]GGV12534.1 N-acetylmuramidase [Lactobacillus acetotolerans DSM 20749 = JCM 3825]